jgi:hypothetical protein
MTYRICQVIISTNRLGYLTKTLTAQKNLNFEGCQVDKIFIDDYPRNRNNMMIKLLVNSFGYNEVHLHEENLGITRTWQDFYNIIKDRNYDYIWQQEDDVEIVEPVKIVDLIEILKQDKSLSQLQLKRNNWYDYETEAVMCKDDDIVLDNYRYEKDPRWFWMMSALYPGWIAKEPILASTGNNPSECVVAEYLRSKFNLCTGLLKTSTGNIMVNHIGEINRGKKVAPGEPSWEGFKWFDPNKDYDSKTGKEIL